MVISMGYDTIDILLDLDDLVGYLLQKPQHDMWMSENAVYPHVQHSSWGK